jgi:predicted alpha-1,2-mannosidase
LKAQNNYLDYVNPFIGTGGHGHTYPGATVPHGMVQLSPDTRLEGWDGCGGYHYSDTFIYGFSHTHLSGTGVSDYGDILMMPTSKDPSPDNRVYGSAFTHRNEKASPGYYCVQLDDDDIITEFTATERVGYHHYVYSSTKEQNIILDLKHRDEVIESSLKIEDSVTVSGMRRSKAWANDQYVFFVIRFSSPIRQSGIWEQDRLLGNEVLQAGPSKNLKAFFRFKPGAGNEIFARVAISPVSVTGAMANLLAETGDKSFLEVRAAAEAKWNTELSKIDVKGNDEKKMRIFYTALYHTAIVPTINMDVDGSYRGRDGQVHKAEGFTYYSVFSLWDTYRAAHPLYTLIDPVRNLDYIKTFLVQYQQGGRLPVWELSSCETDCMIGYHSVSVMADAFVKGIKEFDTKLALKAMVKSASWNHFGLPGYIKNGVINTEDEHESVSKTLEYAYDDYCIAMFAKGIGETEVYNSFIKRAQYYKNILDVKSGFMRPRKNGGWLEPFDPYEVNNHFTEANSWQYSFYFPQDIDGYLKLVGGPKILEKRLDALFTASQQTTGREQSDISGLIGQYAHGNEPSHHIAYLYDFTSRPSKTQSLVHQIMTEMYKDEPDGLIGNEDCGQMSAWYVMSALGFYPVTPGTTRYMIGTPQFNLAEIHLENDRSFIINAPGVSDTSFFIQSALLSTTASLMPKKWEYAYLDHFDITGGGLVTFMMGNKPANCFPKIVSQALQENKSHAGIILNPSINGGGVPFKTSKLVTITSPQKNIRIYYTLDGKDPGPKSLLYARPLSVTRSMMIKAVAIDPKGNKSFVSTAEYKKMPNNWTIRLNAPYEKQFDGGGTDALIDGIRGTTNWRMGNWQGYQKTDPEIVIDLKEIKSISKISIGLLQDTKSWIVLPKEISVEVSTDGRQFRELYKGSNYLPIEDLLPQIKDVEVNLSKTNARFIKVKAVQYGKLPSWHEGAGGDTHIFLDEIDIK